MVVSLKPELQKLVEEKVRAGLFRSPDELLNAAVEQLIGDDDLAPGEMQQLLEAGEADVKAGRLVDGEAVLNRLQSRISPTSRP
jgi:Arc/MetJ-type ribon-helix-helix transcriptional regulator